jgi:hypothetical protein
MIITTTFATWFGSETCWACRPSSSRAGCMPWWKIRFGGMCLILVGLFFAASSTA